MYKLTLIITIFSILTVSAQIDKDSLKTEVVHVVKPYTPKIKDAFKIKKNPVLGEDTINNKKEVNYTIHSFPVASTFTPSKGKAKGVTKKKREHVYGNYISVGFGNYTTPKIDAFAHSSTTRDNDFGATLKFHSSNGIDDTKLDSDFIDARVGVYYKNSINTFDWKTFLNYTYQKQNWYGLHSDNTLTDVIINTINPEQVYNGFDFGGSILYYDSNFKGADLDMHILTDSYNSTEFQVVAKPQFEFSLMDEWFTIDFRLEYLNGKFEKDYANTTSIEYAFYNLGISPTYQLNFDYLTVNIGANLVYSAAKEEEDKFFVYPNVTANYELMPDTMTVYLAVTGDLQQHSYQKFIAANLFVSPTLHIGRTNEKYNAKIGVKGKLASSVSFNLNTSYKEENAKALFKLNSESASAVAANYQYANSFRVFYDNITTLGFSGELIYDYSKEFQLGGNINYDVINTDILEESWNLPPLKTSLFAKYSSKKIVAGVNLFVVGESKDQYITSTDIQDITNKSYADLNINLTYRVTNKFNAFINGNNLLGNNYYKISNYQAQGIQVLGGVKYKFDL